ncbi:unnamed protein product [Hermetia illucens]|uniref:PID domain-containing protein n=1 Tax=Hermetia illucens TaxID=343691 RepID=A0A7R8YR48_HERIL|nr:unnamed protein product [Hermetia illucens]
MSFFRKWKLYTKHKKLSEDWGLATSLKDLSDAGDLDEDQSTTTTFNLKFLGSTPIESEKSKNATAEAIKAVISSSKSSRRKAQRVNLNVSPRGIEMMDVSTGTQILRDHPIASTLTTPWIMQQQQRRSTRRKWQRARTMTNSHAMYSYVRNVGLLMTSR